MQCHSCQNVKNWSNGCKFINDVPRKENKFGIKNIDAKQVNK